MPFGACSCNCHYSQSLRPLLFLPEPLHQRMNESNDLAWHTISWVKQRHCMVLSIGVNRTSYKARALGRHTRNICVSLAHVGDLTCYFYVCWWWMWSFMLSKMLSFSSPWTGPEALGSKALVTEKRQFPCDFRYRQGVDINGRASYLLRGGEYQFLRISQDQDFHLWVPSDIFLGLVCCLFSHCRCHVEIHITTLSLIKINSHPLRSMTMMDSEDHHNHAFWGTS